jgi:hypothetical protein
MVASKNRIHEGTAPKWSFHLEGGNAAEAANLPPISSRDMDNWSQGGMHWISAEPLPNNVPVRQHLPAVK